MRGGSCLRDIYIYIYIRPVSSIELACAVRQPSPCVHSAKVVSCFTCHIFVLHFALLAALFTLHTSHSTLHTSHSTFHTSQSTLHTSRTRPRTVVVVSKNMTRARPRCNVNCQANTFLTLHIAFFTLHTRLHNSHLHFISTNLIALLISCHVFPYVS